MYEVDCFQFTGGILKNEFTFNVTWKPFLLQLIHNLPERGIPLKDYLWQKYGNGYAEDIFSANSSVNRNAAEVVSQWRRKEFKSVCVCLCGGGGGGGGGRGHFDGWCWKGIPLQPSYRSMGSPHQSLHVSVPQMPTRFAYDVRIEANACC